MLCLGNRSWRGVYAERGHMHDSVLGGLAVLWREMLHSVMLVSKRRPLAA